MNKTRLFSVLFGGLLFFMNLFGMSAIALDYSLWPLWPSPSYFPEPPKVIYWSDDDFEIVADANSTEPLTFFSIGRDIMAWGDRMPMIAGELKKSGKDYYFVPLGGEELPKETWGSRMELLDVDPSPEVRTPDLPSDAPIYLGLASGRKEAGNLSLSDLEGGSVIPEFSSSWYDSDGDEVPDAGNQESDATYNDDWVSFLEGHQFLEGLTLKTLFDEDPLFISDGGHSAPVVVWPDNIWLAPMSGWQDFYQSLSYDSYGGAIVFFATNDGKVRAFSVGDDSGSTYEELWSFLPSPALLAAPYHEYWKLTSTISKEPRLIALDGPILVHDIEDTENSNEWKRILVGTTGQGSFLEFKPKEAWDFEIAESAPSSGERGNLFGFYALDVTDPSDPQPFWAVSTARWKDKDDAVQDVLWVNGDYKTTIPTGYGSYQGLRVSVSRPVVGYTDISGTRTWHVLLLGIDSQEKYHAYDIDASTGKCLNDYVLGDVLTITGSDGKQYPNDVVKPSRIGAALLWNQSFPEGTFPNTPLLGEVYLYLSNGTLYKWDVQGGVAPELLLTLRGGQSDEVAMPLQDFDVTFLYVDGQPHRFLAAVSAFSKNGNPSDVLETDHYGLIVIDITLLEQEETPPSLILGSNAFGKTNTVFEPTEYLDFTYVSMRSVDEDAVEFEANAGSHWKTAYPSSAPVFYDGKIILITRSYWIKKHGNPSNQDAWSRTYVVDPLLDTVQKLDVRGVTHLGGALIDENALLYLQTNEGAISQDLGIFGLNALGESILGGGSGTELSEPELVYWRKID